MKENQRRNAEALDWIQSLSLNGEEQNTTMEEYLRGNGSPSKGLIVDAYKHHLLRRGLSKWIRNHKLKFQRDLHLLEQEVNASLRAQKRKSRMCIEQWIDYVSFQQLRVYSARRTELKLSIGMQYRYKLRTCLHYWKLRVRVRRQLKTRLFSLWQQMSRGRLLVKLILRAQIRNFLRESFTRWKRRSKWPLVATKRAIWVENRAFSVLKHHAQKRHYEQAQKRKWELSRIAQHFPTLVTRLIAQKRRKTVLQMGADLYYLKKLTCAITRWNRVTSMQNKIAQCLDRALSRRRKLLIHTCISVLKKHAQRAVRTQIQARTAYLHHKLRTFRRFVRGTRLMQGQKTQIDTTTNTHKTEAIDTYSVLAASAKFLMSHTVGPYRTRAPRYILFRERLYHKETSLLKKWRSCTLGQSIQREARLWGTRWFKRAAFRTLQLNCRKRRNVTLNNCYASLQCKHRLLRLYALHWHRRAALAKSLHLMSSFIYMRKYIRKWVKWCRLFRNHHWKQRRAALRWSVNQQQRALQWWYVSTHRKQHCRYGLRVFRKLHPVPTTSAVGRVFQAWRDEYVPQRKQEKKLYKQVVVLRKYASIKRTFNYWSDAFENSTVNRHNLLRACRVLYKRYSNRRSMIYRLSNALLLRVHNGSFDALYECKLVTFLARHGLMVRTKCQLLYFYVLCFLRKYVYLWQRFAQHRRQQLVFYHHTYVRAAAQCSAYFATYYHVLHKHRKWTQWRGMRAWYSMHSRRMVHFSGINTRIHLKHLFQRWVAVYNRKLINYHLRITAGPTSSNAVYPGRNVLDTHNTTLQSNRTSMSSQFDDTFASTAQHHHTTSHTNYTADSQNTHGRKAVSTMDDSIHLNPAAAHTIASERLHQLRSTKPPSRMNICNISAISAASSAGSTSFQHSQQRAPQNKNISATTNATIAARIYAPKYTSKLIDTTQHTSMNASALSTTSQRSSTAPSTSYSRIYKENKPNKDTNSQSLFSDNPNVSYSRLHENRIDPTQNPGSGFVFAPVADVSSMRVSGKNAYGETLLRKSVDRSSGRGNIVDKKTVWGSLIEEDNVDAAKRSYTGQYLLGKTL